MQVFFPVRFQFLSGAEGVLTPLLALCRRTRGKALMTCASDTGFSPAKEVKTVADNQKYLSDKPWF